MAFDATDLEIARREHLAEMGEESKADRLWSRWHKSATMAVVSNGWETPVTRGLDGCEWEDGFSLDSAYEAFERGLSVNAYILGAVANREALGL